MIAIDFERDGEIMSFSSDDSPLGSPYFDEDNQDVEYFDFVPPAPEHVGRVRRERLRSEVKQTFEDRRPTKKLLPLKELCCRFVGQNFPFGTVQMYPSPVPEDVQKRISFWSFPLEEKKLLDCVMVMSGVTQNDVASARRANVTNMIQSG